MNKIIKKPISKRLLFLISFICDIISIVILMLKLFYPYNRWIAFSIYGLSFVPIILLLKKKRAGTNYFKKHSFEILWILGSLTVLWIIVSLFPIDRFDTLTANKDELEDKIDQEIIILEKYTDKLEESEQIFAAEIKNIDLKSLSFERKQMIKEKWAVYMSYFIAIDKILDDNKYFYQIDVTRYKELNEKSFVLAYTSFVTLYSSAIQTLNNTKDISFIDSLLNEEDYYFEIPAESYTRLKTMVANPTNFVQTTAGMAYLNTIEQKNLIDLKQKAKQRYEELAVFSKDNLKHRFDAGLYFFEKNVFVTWFPVQKSVSIFMGDTKIPVRYESLVTQEDINKVKQLLEPGDVFLERRNWYLSNVGLPGFWKHTAIYVSNLTIIDDYFKEITDTTSLTGNMPVSKFIKKYHPKLYETLSDGNLRTLEAESEGVISFTADYSLAADYIAVLRPKLSKKQKLEGLLYVFKQYEKPYDFNFDFLTDNEIVCSELMYKAYPQLNYELKEISGRLVLSSNHIAEDFTLTYGTPNQKMDLIYFIDADEFSKKAIIGDLDGFSKTYER